MSIILQVNKRASTEVYRSNLCGQRWLSELSHITCMSTIIKERIAMFIMQAYQNNSTRIKYYLSFSKTRGPQGCKLIRTKVQESNIIFLFRKQEAHRVASSSEQQYTNQILSFFFENRRPTGLQREKANVTAISWSSWQSVCILSEIITSHYLKIQAD